jgi:hypothetical protein
MFKVFSKAKEAVVMKRLVWMCAVAALAGLVAAPALASVTVLSENFEGQGYKNKWTFTPSAAWTQLEQDTNQYMAFAGDSGGSAESTKAIRVDDGDLYKITLRYRRGPAEVKLGSYLLGRVALASAWKEVTFMRTTKKQEDLAFKIVVPGTTSLFHFDDVLIARCETAVAPTSLGRVRALFR